MSRNQNHDDASTTKKRINRRVVPWSELNHDVLFTVMMQLGVVDYFAFAGVCKSWRSFALANRNIFMGSKPPIPVRIYGHECRLVNFKSIRLDSDNKRCIGSTCGYLILVSEKPRHVCLVNPITNQQLHFPPVPFALILGTQSVRAFLVFSSSISKWVFVVLSLSCDTIWFCVVGNREWSNVSTPFRVHDLLAFKGKMYAIHSLNQLCEVVLHPTPTFMLLETKNPIKSDFVRPMFGSSGEKLFVIDLPPEQPAKIHQLYFDEMKWGSCEKTPQKCASFYASLNRLGEFVPEESWTGVCPLYGRYAFADIGTNWKLYLADGWYFLNEFSNVNYDPILS